MNLILQVHDGGEGAVAAFQPLLLLRLLRTVVSPQPRARVARGSQPYGQRQVQSHIQHVKPESPVGVTPEARDALRCQERADGQSGTPCGRSLWLRLALRAIEMLRRESSAAGTVLAEGAVAVLEVCTRSSSRGLAVARGRTSTKAAVSDVRLEGVSLRQAADAAAAAGRARQTDVTHAVVGMRKRDRLAAP